MRYIWSFAFGSSGCSYLKFVVQTWCHIKMNTFWVCSSRNLDCHFSNIILWHSSFQFYFERNLCLVSKPIRPEGFWRQSLTSNRENKQWHILYMLFLRKTRKYICTCKYLSNPLVNPFIHPYMLLVKVQKYHVMVISEKYIGFYQERPREWWWLGYEVTWLT